MHRMTGSAAAALLVASPAAAQSHATRVEGRWEARAGEAIHSIVVRSDSSAQFGEQVARWRVVGDSLWLTLGDGLWMVYGMRVSANRLTLAGGDLAEPVTLRRVGHAAPRAAAVAIPQPPAPDARAW